MAGSTSRCALKVQNAAYGLCSQGVNGVNSDVIMILHVDPAHHRLALLSIPRDLFIPNARNDGPNKVDAALYAGMSQLVAAIEEDFGIPIQHAVSLNFDQFANVVDALNGINMSFPMSVFDQESGLNVPRRSIYFRSSKEKKVTFLAMFDSPNVTDCYRRSETVVPQQALAMVNSSLSLAQARRLAQEPGDAS